jgi:hypothetical protein
MTPIEISGIGIVGPGACSVDEFRRLLYSAGDEAEAHAVDPAAGVPVLRVDDTVWNHGISKRVLRRLDRFTQLGIYAAEQSLAAVSEREGDVAPDRYRIGLSIGNNYGGWTYVDPMMAPLYERGMAAINPFVATAWFPAAPQGEISIRLGIKGTSKTFAVERLSAAYAIDFAAFLLEHDALDVAVAGGAEAPLTPAVLASMAASQLVCHDVPAGEAACMLTLRPATSGDRPQIVGLGKGADPRTALGAALRDADVAGAALDLVLIDPPRGAGDVRRAHLSRQLDSLEALCDGPLPVAQPLPFGETVGASFSIQLAAACVALDEQQAPRSRLVPEWAAELHHRKFRGTHGALVTIAALSSDDHGQWMAAVVTAPHGTVAGRSTGHVH